MKVKTILVSQPEPTTNTSPYYNLVQNQKVKVDFCPFIHIEGVDSIDIREQKININNYQSVIFTSKNAADHFFRLAEKMRCNIIKHSEIRFFCQTEAIASHLKKYVTTYRKRKIHVGKKNFTDLCPILKKYNNRKFLLPSSDVLQPSIIKTLDNLDLEWDRVIMYRTVCSNLSHLKDIFYDVLVFFSPLGIKSLLENFPDFKQNDIRIAAFGKSTAEAVEAAGLRCDIKAPTTDKPSMTIALENYIQQVNKR